MKIFVYLSFFAALFTPTFSRAELLIYRGTFTESFIGENRSVRVSSRMFFIIDRQTANIARIDYAIVNGIKHYRTTQTTNLLILQIAGPGTRSYSALARPASDCDSTTEPTNGSVYVKGINTTLIVGANQTISFPAVMTGVGNAFFYSTVSNQPIHVQGNITAVFSRTETVASNNAGETLDAALARLAAYVESLGYTQ